MRIKPVTVPHNMLRVFRIAKVGEDEAVPRCLARQVGGVGAEPILSAHLERAKSPRT